ncbi:DUF4136 domain-containing protein [Pseudohalioglobus lutimaris]|uniref:DUF4136 domain-containing protein n=1 Tax=Pseudohalioglobus lutimaris TaxID=1737061 RepID=A0A2N5X414_9GAMM|nr:DUF4136 domain-containing protein [Pseudohalioglobus lutimaris]PLW69213.1 DUF4136 domain-containing protein [Pseudohalioglobus lutimaris]
MRSFTVLATLMLIFGLTACSTIETRPEDTARFVAGQYKYFTWRSQPLNNPGGSSDPLYTMDPMIREQVNAQLVKKGYILDPARAQFSVDYLQATALREGVSSQDASGGIDPIPSARPNRQINQAMVDNANALAGVQTTNNIAIQFNDMESQEEVWRVVVTKIVDDVNRVDANTMRNNLQKGISKGMSSLPDAS